MGSFVTENAVLIAVICALVAVVYGVVLRSWLMKLPAGDEKMQAVAGAVQEGAKAYLNRQYRTIAMVGAVVFVILLVASACRRTGRTAGTPPSGSSSAPASRPPPATSA